jgi:hypothetical protein
MSDGLPSAQFDPEPQSHIAVGQLVQRQREEQGGKLVAIVRMIPATSINPGLLCS